MAAKYNVPNNDDGHYNMVIRSTGCNLLLTSLIVLFIIVGEMDRYDAYLAVSTIWFVEHLGRVLNKEGARNGGSDLPNATLVVIDALILYGYSMGGDWPSFTAQNGVVALFFFGLGFACFTHFFLHKIWLVKEDFLTDPKHSAHRYFLSRVFGLTMVQSAVLMTALEFGQMDIVPAFGIACGVLAMSILILPLISTNAADMGIATRHVFMGVACALAAFRMFQKDGVATGEAEAASEE